MTTFADISNFDWASMVNDDRKEADSNTWFDKFINDEQGLPAVNSNSNTSTGSPLEFSSLFDREVAETESLFSSNVTSLDNSPMVKTEDVNSMDIPQLDITNSTVSNNNNNDNNLTRHASTVSMGSVSSDSSESSPNAETGSTPANSSTSKKPKKKRAPRKRLTPHQKQAHNKIEKRYRININAKIAGLQQIIPWVSAEKTAFETGDGQKPDEEADTPRLNKSMILEKATGYILHMQEEEKAMKEKLQKLSDEVKRLGGDPSSL